MEIATTTCKRGNHRETSGKVANQTRCVWASRRQERLSGAVRRLAKPASGRATTGSAAASARQLQTTLKLLAKPEPPARARYVRRESENRHSDFRVTRTITLLLLFSQSVDAVDADTFCAGATLPRAEQGCGGVVG